MVDSDASRESGVYDTFRSNRSLNADRYVGYADSNTITSEPMADDMGYAPDPLAERAERNRRM